MVGRIAANQHGVVTFAQLARAGLSPASIDRRVKAGRLHRLFRGVYAVGHRKLSREGRWMAAVLACGEGAALSHSSAAHLWSLSPTSPPSAHVTVPGDAGRASRRGIVLHRSTTLTPSDVTRRHNIPVTTEARTKRDMGWSTERTRSDLERKFLALLRSHELPLPEVNARLGPFEVDFLWRNEGLIVELDGFEFHSSRASFEGDRRRDRELQLRGFAVMRFTHRDFDQAPEILTRSLRGRRSARRP